MMINSITMTVFLINRRELAEAKAVVVDSREDPVYTICEHRSSTYVRIRMRVRFVQISDSEHRNKVKHQVLKLKRE
jgi:hypothetical protein